MHLKIAEDPHPSPLPEYRERVKKKLSISGFIVRLLTVRLGRSSYSRRGISLVELLVVVAIISIVMSMVLVVLVKTWHVVESFRH